MYYTNFGAGKVSHSYLRKENRNWWLDNCDKEKKVKTVEKDVKSEPLKVYKCRGLQRGR